MAQYDLGAMYYRGEEVPQDFAQALKWFRLAAEQGDMDAESGRPELEEFCRGVPDN